MKFNRLELLIKLKSRVEAEQAKFETDSAAWAVALDKWNDELISWQHEALFEVGQKLLALAEMIDQPLTDEQLRIVPRHPKNGRYGSAGELDLLTVNTPSQIGDVKAPRTPSHAGVLRLIATLEAATDDFVTTTALYELNFKDVMRAWL